MAVIEIRHKKAAYQSVLNIKESQRLTARSSCPEVFLKMTYEQLLNKTGRNSMSINRLRTLCVEIYKALNEQNLSFMKNIFTVNETEI